MTPQHPAAPEGEGDVSGLTEAEREALNIAVDEAETCARCGDDYGSRHVYAAVERIVAERLRVVEGERDAAPTGAAAIGRVLDLEGQVDLARARAESAEAAHARTIAGVRAWCAANEIAEPPLDWAGLGEFLDRALLAGGGA